jgi:hypothetical protein
MRIAWAQLRLPPCPDTRPADDKWRCQKLHFLPACPFTFSTVSSASAPTLQSANASSLPSETLAAQRRPHLHSPCEYGNGVRSPLVTPRKPTKASGLTQAGAPSPSGDAADGFILPAADRTRATTWPPDDDRDDRLLLPHLSKRSAIWHGRAPQLQETLHAVFT